MNSWRRKRKIIIYNGSNLKTDRKLVIGCFANSGPDSLVVRVSASGTERRGFSPRPHHTKGVKNGTGSSLVDARNKRVILGRYKNAGRYLLLIMSQ